MSKLISGKEALIALANGCDVEFYIANQWHSLAHSRVPAKNILEDNYQFRLKPRTIKINGIEVPAPFEPEDDNTYFVLNDHDIRGYQEYEYVGHVIKSHGFKVIGYWRTEEEFKQVVAALRKVFGVQP